MAKVHINPKQYIEEHHELHFKEFVHSCHFHKWPHECEFVRDSLGIFKSNHEELQNIIDICEMDGFKDLMNNALTLIVKMQSIINEGGKLVSMNMESGEIYEPIFSEE